MEKIRFREPILTGEPIVLMDEDAWNTKALPVQYWKGKRYKITISIVDQDVAILIDKNTPKWVLEYLETVPIRMTTVPADWEALTGGAEANKLPNFDFGHEAPYWTPAQMLRDQAKYIVYARLNGGHGGDLFPDPPPPPWR